MFKLVCERIQGDKELGKVNVPVKELLDSSGEGGSMKIVSFQVKKLSGRAKGSLDFSYRFGDMVAVPVKPEKNKGGDDHHQPVTAYPAGHMATVSSSGVPYGIPRGYPPPPQAGYGYPPPPPHVAAGYGGYPPQGVPLTGYGYPPPQQPGYGYPPPGGYGYPSVQHPPKKNSNFGLGAGLVGGAIGGC
ncbi:Phi class glutathione transferase GSTF7 [Hibiscus syriacus]|uniref:Phi class glutathione transferase GSTF7 n=1 Tax=Hibiscus syriacus TaxID=106335 RepID=A0A6A3D3S9_HIBSY|nr:Phi class glutathione transferase GSTF7 [Hibiscus syriacus]